MNHLVDEMLAKYRADQNFTASSAFREVAQDILLSALSQTDFFSHAAFYGGTCLRIFHHLDRFSEDLDFGLIREDPEFSLAGYLPAIDKTFASLGLSMQAKIREKSVMTNVESAYVDGPMRDILIEFFPDDKSVEQIVFNQRIKIKFEVGEHYVPGANFEFQSLLLPTYSRVLCFDLPSLCAGKIAAVLSRGWKKRVKGRDYYDFVFYVSRGIEPNMDYLREQLVYEGVLSEQTEWSQDTLIALLKDKFAQVDFDVAKKDVLRFIHDGRALEHWDASFFSELADRLFHDGLH